MSVGRACRDLARGLDATTGRAFAELLAAQIKRLTHVPVTASDFDLSRIPQHLQMTFRVVDERGRTVDSGKDLRELQRRLGGKARESVAAASVAAAPNAIEKSGLTTWYVRRASPFHRHQAGRQHDSRPTRR